MDIFITTFHILSQLKSQKLHYYSKKTFFIFDEMIINVEVTVFRSYILISILFYGYKKSIKYNYQVQKMFIPTNI